MANIIRGGQGGGRPRKKPVQTHRSEQALIESAVAELEGRVLCTTLGRAQFAGVGAALPKVSAVECFFLDLFLAEESRRVQGEAGGRLKMICQPDPPEEEYDVAAVPTTKNGEAELVRDLLQAAFLRLSERGMLIASTDNRRDGWLQDEMKALGGKVTAAEIGNCRVYTTRKQGPPKKVRDFSAETVFRDHDRLLKLVSRPGVFSHRQIDVGARALIESLPEVVEGRALDLGCGSGAVAMAMAARWPQAKVTAADSNPRAIKCTERGAELNELSNVEVHLTPDARVPEQGGYSLVAGNPPYFSHFRIATLFLDATADALAPGGLALMVTKRPDWFREQMSERFRNVDSRQVRNYHVVSGIR